MPVDFLFGIFLAHFYTPFLPYTLYRGETRVALVLAGNFLFFTSHEGTKAVNLVSWCEAKKKDRFYWPVQVMFAETSAL